MIVLTVQFEFLSKKNTFFGAKMVKSDISVIFMEILFLANCVGSYQGS